MNNTKDKLVLVLGSSATALAIVRELNRVPDTSIVVASLEQGCANASRFVKESWVLSDLSDLTKKIEQVSRRYNIVLMPSSDLFVEWVCHNAAVLNQFCFFDDCYLDQIALKLLDKETFSSLASENNLLQPQVYSIDDFSQQSEVIESYPIFIKPKIIHQKRSDIPGKKGMVIRNKEQWLDWFSRYKSSQKDWLAQEIILGSEDNIMLFVGCFDSKYQLIDCFTARKLRQSPIGFGSASLVITEFNQDIVDMSCKLLSKVGYSGVCSGEFKWCGRRNQWVVIEFNPRPALWYSVATASGALIVSQVISRKLNLENIPIKNNKAKVLWRYGLKDLFSQWKYFKNKNFVLPKPKVKPHLKFNYKRTYPVFTLADIKPFFAELRTYLTKLIKRILRIT